MKIGIVGYSALKFDTNVARDLINKGLDHFKANENDILVSGLTALGIPLLAYEEAVKRGMQTYGVACKEAEECEQFPVDLKALIGENWGDESNYFLNLIDVLVKIGGGPQSEKEFALFTGPKIEYELDSI